MSYQDEPISDYEAAKHWFRIAAEDNNAEAQYYLAQCLSVKGDHIEAQKWLQESAK